MTKQCLEMNVFKRQCERHKGHKGFHYYPKEDYEQSRGAKSSDATAILKDERSHISEPPLIKHPPASLPSCLDEIQKRALAKSKFDSEDIDFGNKQWYEGFDRGVIDTIQDVQEMVIRRIIEWRKMYAHLVKHKQFTLAYTILGKWQGAMETNNISEEMIEDYKRKHQ